MNFEIPKMPDVEKADGKSGKSFFQKIRDGKIGKTAKAAALVASLAGPASAEAFDSDSGQRSESAVSTHESKEQVKELFSGTIPHTGEQFSIQLEKGRHRDDECFSARIFIGGEEWECQGTLGKRSPGTDFAFVAVKNVPVSGNPGKTIQRKFVLRLPSPGAKHAPLDASGDTLPFYSEFRGDTPVVKYEPLGDVKGWNPKDRPSQEVVDWK